jgi:hypothetical protein
MKLICNEFNIYYEICDIPESLSLDMICPICGILWIHQICIDSILFVLTSKAVSLSGSNSLCFGNPECVKNAIKL